MKLGGADRSAWRLFLAYAGASLIPVLILGAVLSVALAREARAHGLAEGRAEAGLVARTAIEPLLDGRTLAAGLSAGELAGLRRMTDRAVGTGQVLRMRVRSLSGNVVYSDDGSDVVEADDDAEDAAKGAVVAGLTRLNTDLDDVGPAGPRVVEVYLPLRSTAASSVICPRLASRRALSQTL